MPIDYRLKENRLEAFIKFYTWQLTFKDNDPALWMMNYLNQRFEHNSEQRLWFSWLYANTYYLPTAWVLFQEFPDYECATLDRLELWNTENYKRLRYQTDTKYNKGHLPVMFASYQKAIGKRLQRSFFESLYGDNEKQTFDNLWTYILKHFHKFGRYTAWFYLQTLKHTAGICVEATSLMLSDYEGSRSHRNGLCYAISKYGYDGWIDVKPSLKEYQAMEEFAKDIMFIVKTDYQAIASEVDAFSMETALCAFKKIWRKNDSRYLGYYLDRQGEEISRVSQDGWWGIEWDVLWQARQETLDPRLHDNRIMKDKFNWFLDTGELDRLDWLETQP